MRRLYAAFCVLFMIGTIPMGILGGNGPDVNGLPGEDDPFSLAAEHEGSGSASDTWDMGSEGQTPPPAPQGALDVDVSSRFSFDVHIASEDDIEVLKDRCGLFDPESDRVAIIDGHGTGLVPPTEEEYTTLEGAATWYDGVTLSPGDKLPGKIDHSTEGYFPPVDTQGQMGSCAAWSAVYYAATYAQAKDEGWTDCSLGTNTSRLMSPNWAYNKVNHGYDGGSHTWTNAQLLATLGCSDWKNMPYSDTDQLDWGDEDAWRIAPRYRLQEQYDVTYTYNTMVLKTWVVQGFVVPFALNAGYYTTALGPGDNVISSSEYSGTSYNHANTIVGYDDNITADGDAGAFKIVNSWGKNWGAAWGGNGYYWMTYDAVAELVYPAIRIYDRVDWEPTLLATINQTTNGSRDSRIVLGTDSGLLSNREPKWDGGKSAFPEFMAVDVTELEEDLGLTDFWLYVGSGDNASTVGKFELEWYENGYLPKNPTRKFTSPDTPKTAPGYMDISAEDIHINVTSPLDNALVSGVVTLEGNCTDRIGRVILTEDFEGPWNKNWVNVDANTISGLDTWGDATYRRNAGNRSVWCAGSDAGVAFFEDFNGGSVPTGWTTYSPGEDTYPWSVTNSGYNGTGTHDHVAVANSNRGAGTNITEWLYMTTPFNASAFTDLELRFYLEYDYWNGSEYGEVLYATGSTYPTFTNITNQTSDTYGYESYDISALDGEDEVYLAFLYHGTEDRYMVVDDVLVVGEKTKYDQNVSANLYKQAPCSGYDNVTLEYYYWLESETDNDGLWSMYWSSTDSAWRSLQWHTGSVKQWTKVTVEVPQNATYIGFLFYSDGSTAFEGAYLDDVTLTGYIDLDSVDLKVDSGSWTQINTSAVWSHDWDSDTVTEDSHTLYLRADYNGDYSYDRVTVLTDITPPTISSISNDMPTTGETMGVYINVSDNNGIGSVVLSYSFNGQTYVGVSLSGPTGTEWTYLLPVPGNATTLSYRFWVEDGLGNGKWSSITTVVVTDNDAPTLLADTTPTAATTGDPLAFAITASDNVAVDEIYVRYWYDGDSTSTNVSASGDVFEHTITVLHTLKSIHYELGVFDTSGFMDTTSGTVTVSDNDGPELASDGTLGTATTGETVTFSIDVTDNIALSEVRVLYRFGSGTSQNVTMTNVASNSWSLTLAVPGDSLAKLYYRFTAGDAAGNWNTSTEAVVDVLDNDMPTFGTDSTVATATTGDAFTFSIEAGDNVAVQGVWVLYRYGTGTQRNGTLSSSAGLLWKLVITIDDTLQGLTYSFGTEDSSGNVNTTIGGSVSISDNDIPTFGTDSTPATGSTGDPLTFSIRVSDNIALDGTWLTYQYDTGTPVNVTLTSSDGIVWTHSITVGDTLEDITYTVGSIDTSGNEASTLGRTVNIHDNDAPTFGTDATPATATTGDPFTFSIEISDNIEVLGVWVVYQYGSGTPVNTTVTSTDDLVWKHTMDVEHTILDLTYTFGTEDTSGNVDTTSGGTVVIADNDGPNFGTDATPATATTGDPLTFSIGVSDNIEVQGVWVVYQYGSGTPENGTMSSLDDLVWTFLMDVEHTVSDLTYTFGTVDTSGNVDTTPMGTVVVADNDVPTFGDDLTPALATTGDPFTFSVNVGDNIDLEEVHLVYRFGSGAETNASMDSGSPGLWVFEINVPADSVEPLHYRFEAVDTSSNWNGTTETSVDVRDNILPIIETDNTPDEGTTGDPFTFSTVVTDNIGMEAVWVEYRYGEGTLENISLAASEGDVWEVTITMDETLEDMDYRVGILDISGNIDRGSWGTVDVIDNELPEIVEDLTTTTATTGDPFVLAVTVQDNIGIDSVVATYAFGDASPSSVAMVRDGDRFTLAIDVPSDSADALTYEFSVLDLAGNSLASPEVQVTVVDDDSPTITYEPSIREAAKGVPLGLSVLYDDNIGVEGFFIVCRFGDGAEQNESALGGHELDIPRHPDGDLHFHFAAVDAAGNWVRTGEYTVMLVNVPPSVSGIPTWDVTEATDAQLDLVPYISDPNDDEFTMTCSDDTVAVEGLVLKVRHDEPVADRTVTLKMSDGEDDTSVTLTIHVVNVNDQPVIMSFLPADGTEYKKGKKIVFTIDVSDEDGDDLTITWKDGDKVLGTGSPFEYSKLGTGKRTITVVVDDGTGEVAESFSVVVKEEEGGIPSIPLVGALAAIGIVAAIVRRRDR